MDCQERRVPRGNKACRDYQALMAPLVTQEERAPRERKACKVYQVLRGLLGIQGPAESRELMELEVQRGAKERREKMASLGSKVTWASRETGVITELQVLVERMAQRG